MIDYIQSTKDKILCGTVCMLKEDPSLSESDFWLPCADGDNCLQNFSNRMNFHELKHYPNFVIKQLMISIFWSVYGSSGQ